jgi:predicted dithiol-disulfide oxidoreductase (DUF899 family)
MYIPNKSHLQLSANSYEVRKGPHLSLIKMSLTDIQRYPDGAGQEYIKARHILLKEEQALTNQVEKVAALRRSLPQGAVAKDYNFDAYDGKRMSLADLTANGRSLVIFHFMFSERMEQPCSMCSMFVDTANSLGKHYEQVINYAVICKAPIAKMEAYAKKRGWNDIRFLSSTNNTFNKDYHVEYPKWAPEEEVLPGISVFKKDSEGNVRHVYSQSAHYEPNSERAMDLLSPFYQTLDLVPEGRGNFYPSNDYVFQN